MKREDGIRYGGSRQGDAFSVKQNTENSHWRAGLYLEGGAGRRGGGRLEVRVRHAAEIEPKKRV